ncbi:MAG: phosphoglycerate kinase [Candidatus Uhrbacteria bacterium]
MHLRTINDLGDLKGKRVLVRVDFNVPLARSRILDDGKIRFSLPTIERLRAAGARIILVSHRGEGAPSETLAPVVVRLRSLLGGRRPLFIRERIGTESLGTKINRLRDGDVALLENIRFYPGETKNGAAFAKQLAALADCYVNDAFAVCHRKHASVVRVATLLPSAAGLLVERETQVLTKVLDRPERPFVALMGGAKLTTKIPVIENLLGVADVILLGGALASAFLAARGYGVGASLVDLAGMRIARKLLRRSARKNLILPIDVVVAARGGSKGRSHGIRVVPIASRRSFMICGEREAILDIGPQTIRAYSQQVRSARTIVWNGPMGVFERDPFYHGSVALARMIAARSSGRAFGVVGGGETLAVLARTGMARYIDHVSSGGGAMLAFLAGEELPGLVALRANT